MSISETNKIDIIGVHPDSSIVRLVITDHLTWQDFEAHAHILQKKINTYLEFIESGQLNTLQEPKIPSVPEIHIELALQYRPSIAGEHLIANVRQFLSNVGITLDVKLY